MSIQTFKPKVTEFLNLTKVEELLPKFMTRLKCVSVSSKDVVEVGDPSCLTDINLLKGVVFDKYRYVGILGVIVSGEWLLPKKIRGSVAVSLVDKRLTDVREAVIGCYKAQAKSKTFSFKLVPNYFVTANDAARNPWQLMVQLSGLRFEESWSPLTLEVVSVVICANSIVSKGLREKILQVGDENIDFEKAVDDYIDNVPSFASLRNLRYGRGPSFRNRSSFQKNQKEFRGSKSKGKFVGLKKESEEFVGHLDEGLDDNDGTESYASSDSFSSISAINGVPNHFTQSSRLPYSVMDPVRDAHKPL
ncbi:MP [Hoya chlorotic spot virus]|uniref:MP n=1 Tax=Hoya chlorotic spot virus TaxID=1979541 RepID=UPI000A16C6AB|nr:MP [Hoya chlorotic spot virus]ARI47180.1 MP [Hoya chlorotic spot virus]